MKRLPCPDAIAHAAWLSRLSMLLMAGLPLQQALPLLRLNQPARFQPYWQRVVEGVEQGLTLSRSVQPLAGFTAMDRLLIACGEEGGRLEDQLSRLAGRHQRQLHVRRQVRKALRYPLVVMAGTLLVTGFLLARVVPEFATLYGQFGAALPALTQGVLNASDWLATDWPWLLTALLLPVLAHAVAWRYWSPWRHAVLSMLWHLPPARTATRTFWIGGWHRLLADLLGSGLTLPDALDRCAALVAESPLADGQSAIKQAVLSGRTLAAAIHDSANFPPESGSMIALGEESGMLVNMLETLANDFEQRFDSACEQLLALLEPLLMGLLGLLIGALVMALYLPLFQLGQVIS